MPKEKEGGHEKKAKKVYCSECSAGITQDAKIKKDKNEALRGKFDRIQEVCKDNRRGR